MKKLIPLLALVLCLHTKAQIITTVAGNGIGGYSGDGGQATAAEIYHPNLITLDAAGNIYVADYLNNRVRKINTSGVITSIAGNGNQAYGGDNGQATAAELNGPCGLVFDGAGNLYISDSGNNRVRKINSAGIITTVAGNGNAGYSGDGAAATLAELDNTGGIALDAALNIYITDANNNCIRKVSTTGVISTFAGRGAVGYTGDGGQATAAELNTPVDVKIDTAGNVYFSDFSNNCVRKVNTAGIIITVAGNGVSGYAGDGGQATLAQLNKPNGLSLDAFGNLYIADFLNERVRKINTAGIITTIAGNGTAGYSGDGGQATAAEFSEPDGLAFDGAGNLYVTDNHNDCIRKITNASTAGIEQFAGSSIPVNIYPNPSKGSFVIEPGNSTKQSMQLYDVNGKLVLSQTILGKTSIDGSALPEGVYTLHVLSNGNILTKQVLIVK